MCSLPANQSANPLTILHVAPQLIERSKWSNVIRYPPLATSMMLISEEVRRPFQRPVSFLLTSEVQHVNRIDRSFGAGFVRWRGLGILPVARLARLQDQRRTMGLDPCSQCVL